MSDLEKRAYDLWIAICRGYGEEVALKALRAERKLAFDEAATRLQEMIDADTICISPDEIRALAKQ